MIESAPTTGGPGAATVVVEVLLVEVPLVDEGDPPSADGSTVVGATDEPRVVDATDATDPVEGGRVDVVAAVADVPVAPWPAADVAAHTPAATTASTTTATTAPQTEWRRREDPR